MEGSPGAPQSSTTFHHVIPIIGFMLNHFLYRFRAIMACIILPFSVVSGAVIVISLRCIGFPTFIASIVF